jgi:hypothetical protein
MSFSHIASHIVSRNPAIVERVMREEAGVLLLNTWSGAYYRLNRIGALVWRLLDEPIRCDELERRVRVELADAPQTLTEELADHVADLARRDLVHLQPPMAP